MISLTSYITNNSFTVKVIPNASRTELIEENKALKLYLKAQPQKGKANEQLIKFFKKEYNLKVEITKGKTSRTKFLFIKNI
jgi:uncharacterized protein